MEIVVGVLALVGGLFVISCLVYFFASARKMVRWNEDRKQQELALMLISAGRCSAREAVQVALEIRSFINKEDWSRAEAADRIAHALSMVKIAEPGAVYSNATEVGLSIAKGEI